MNVEFITHGGNETDIRQQIAAQCAQFFEGPYTIHDITVTPTAINNMTGHCIMFRARATATNKDAPIKR